MITIVEKLWDANTKKVGVPVLSARQVWQFLLLEGADVTFDYETEEAEHSVIVETQAEANLIGWYGLSTVH